MEPRFRLLMTARRDFEQGAPSPLQQAPELQSMVEEMCVPELDLESAVQILRWGFGSTEQRFEGPATALAEQCQRVPLHLSMAAGILRAGRAGHEVRLAGVAWVRIQYFAFIRK